MAKVTMQASSGSDEILEYPMGVYECEILKVEHVASNFKDDRTGEEKFQWKITWQTTDGNEKWFTQFFGTFYGFTKKGTGKSKLMEFIHGLVDQGLLELDEDGGFDTDDLVGIKQAVSVSPPSEKGWNKVNGTGPIAPAAPVRRKVAPQPQQPTPAPVAPVSPRPVRKNVPAPVDDVTDEDLEF